MTEALVDKLMALVLALAGLAGLITGHLTDGAETAALFVTVSGAAGVVGLQVLAAVARAVLTGQVPTNGTQTNGSGPTIIPPGGGAS